MPSSSTPSVSARRRSGIASIRCRTARASAREKPWTQAAHRGMKAEGGWAAVCTEYAPISPDSDEAPLIAARFWDEDDMRALRLITEAAHEHGALAGIELHHSGGHATNHQTRWPALGPSQLASDLEPRVVPKAMDRGDIRRVQDDWAAAARRARDCGFDIVYVYGAHSYLPMQFLSTSTTSAQTSTAAIFEPGALLAGALERVRQRSATTARWPRGSPSTRWARRDPCR